MNLNKRFSSRFFWAGRSRAFGLGAVLALWAVVPACNDDVPVDVDEVLGELTAGGTPVASKGKALAVTPFKDDVSSRTQTEARALLRTADAYGQYFGHKPPADVSFPKEWAVFYAAGSKNTGGYVAEIAGASISADGKTLEIVTSLQSPGPNCPVTQAFTTPHALAKIPAAPGAKVVFRHHAKVRDCGDPQPTNPCAAILCQAGTTCVVLASYPPQAKCLPAEEEPTDPCATVRCKAGTHCEATPVQCIKAPCPAVASCVEDKVVRCGGFAGTACPGVGRCVDDPSDSCDPNAGGADCGGICRCDALAKCVEGNVWDSSPGVCSCVAATK